MLDCLPPLLLLIQIAPFSFSQSHTHPAQTHLKASALKPSLSPGHRQSPPLSSHDSVHTTLMLCSEHALRGTESPLCFCTVPLRLMFPARGPLCAVTSHKYSLTEGSSLAPAIFLGYNLDGCLANLLSHLLGCVARAPWLSLPLECGWKCASQFQADLRYHLHMPHPQSLHVSVCL